MKKSTKILLSVAVLCGLVFIFGRAEVASADVSAFPRTLMVGSSGNDVLSLQKILNQDPATRIEGSGPGSPGQETAYFGALTQDAVIRFQEKNAQAILYPNGLVSGTGIVGPATRLFLASKAAVATTVSSPTASATGVQTSQSAQNPNNLKNIDRFLAMVSDAGSKQGTPPATLAAIKAQIVKDVSATTTDLREAFLKTVRTVPHQAAAEDRTFIGTVLAVTERAFDRFFRPEKAQAAAAAVPFGGALLFPFYCICSETWIIALEPLPPSYAVLLTYVPFTEAFASYDIPITNWLLGYYEPAAGVCLEYIGYGCAEIPAEGMITPFVGSSPL